MYVKRLELQGFKSFATRTVFEFNAGTTAIVGPNGTGKSNIADAIRWVMGEQRYRSLRARQGEDLIFSGSEKRARTGMAEAILTFDNSSGWLPIEYSEVSVGRRAYRSGDNEYLLNGQKVRRHDLVELLAKGGLKSNNYTVISQGLTDAALSMRPQERRQLFEEAAGIAIYKDKRNSAIRKLEATQENLLRVSDIITEITPLLNTLHRQSKKAATYRSLQQELEEDLKCWYGYRWQNLLMAIQEVKAEKEVKEESLATLRQRLSQLAREGKELEPREKALRQRLDLWRQEKTSLLGKREGLLKELAVGQERLRLLRAQVEEWGRELGSLEGRREAESRKREAINEERKRLKEERASLESRLAAQPSAASLPEQLSPLQELAFQLATRSAELRSQLAQSQERERNFQKEIDEQTEASATLQAQLSRLEESVERFENERSGLKREIEPLEAQEAERQATLQASLLKQRELEIRGERAGREARAFMGAPSVDASGEGMVGCLADLITVSPRFRRAVEAALGPLLEGIVVESWADAERLLMEHNHLIFLPLEIMREPKALPPPEGPHILGPASRYVDFQGGFRRLMDSLLGRTIVVEDLATAKRLHQEGEGDFQLVTLQGELLTPQGVLIAGPLLEKESIERELEREKARYQALLSEAKREKDERQRLEERLKAKETTLSKRHQQLGRLRQEIEWRESIKAKREEGLRDTQRALSELTGQLEETRSQEEKALADLAAFKERLAIQDSAEKLRTSLAVLEEKERRNRSLLRDYRTNLKQIGAQIEAKQSQKEELSQEVDALAQRLQAQESRTQELSTRLEAIQGHLEAQEEELTSLHERQRHREKEEAELRDALHRGEIEHSQTLSELERRKERLANLRSQIEADLESVALPSLPQQLTLDLEAPLPSLPPVSQPPEGLEAKIKRLKRRLRRIGPVNPEAPTEYERVKARHDFLTSQAEDLEKAAGSLRKAIAKLNRLMEERFQVTFSSIAQEFSTYFTTLFNGGKGKLLLTDPQDLADTGVEIVVRPPGKRGHNVDLLSGGERSLTGVALVFAILKATATPFCLLDEVDATLDEINVGRFRESLKALSQRTQIVVITHNRGTIEAADFIYGLSLGEEGSSQVLSLRLEDVENY